MTTAGPSGLFSVPAYFIVLRETLEAALVCSVLLGVLKKTNLSHLNKYVWYGVGLGLLFTVLVLVGVVVGFNAAADRILESAGGENATLDEAKEAQERASLRLRMILSFSAAALIAAMCWTLDGILKKQKEIEAEVEHDVEDELKDRKAVTWRTVFFLSGTTVAREGVETVIFLSVGAGFETRAIPIPVVTGFISGCLCGVGLYRAGSRLALVWFFRISVIFLAFVGAGIFAHGFEELYRLQTDDSGWWWQIVYNISSCCSLYSEGWGLFRALLGYTPYPTRAEMIGYFSYHLIIIIGFIIKWQFERRGIEPDKIFQEKMNQCLGRKKEKVLEISDEEKNTENKNDEAKVDVILAENKGAAAQTVKSL